MNKIYRIIWSKTKNCWIVVSEIAKRHGKAAARKGGTAVLGGLVAASLLAGMTVCRPVWAGIKTDNGNMIGTVDSGTASGVDSMVGGEGNKASGDLAFAFGQNGTASGYAAVAWGQRAKATNFYTTAWGQDTLASGKYSTAFGASAYGSDGVTIVRQLEAKGVQSTAFGSGTWAYGDLSTAFGSSTSAMEFAATAFGEGSVAKGRNSTAWGHDTSAEGPNATAWGWQTVAKGEQATAFGRDTTVDGDNSVVGGYDNTINGSGSFAFGYHNHVYGGRSAAWGDGSTIGDKEHPFSNATAFGKGSAANANNSLAALGGSTTAADSAAIGVNATVSQAGTVALGTGSKADVEAGRTGYNPLSAASTTGNAWKSTNAAIAVGNGSTLTRQIVGVAAGTNPTDAVNVAQLKALADAVDNIDVSSDPVLNTEGNSGTGSVALATQKLKVQGTNSNITTTASGQKINVALSDTLTGLRSVQVGPVTINDDGINAGNKQIKNVAPGTSGTDAVNLTQLNTTVNNVHFTVANGSTGTGTSSGSSSNVYSGNTVTFRAGDNMKLEQSGNTLTYSAVDKTTSHTFALSDQNGNNKATSNVDGAVQVIGANGITTSVVNNRLQISLSNPANGLTFDGDTGTATVPLDNKVTVKGGITTAGQLSDNNIGVVSEQSGKNGVLTVKLAKNINLGADGSVKMGNTTINNTGLTIASGPSVTNNGIDAGSKRITNVAPGTSVTDAVNLNQLNAAKTEVKSDGGTVNVTQSTGSNGQTIYNLEVDKGARTFGLKDSNGDEVTRATGSTIAVVGADKNITTDVEGTGNSARLTVKLADELTVKSVTVDDSVTIGDTIIEEGDDVRNIYGDKINRITVDGETVATLSDGLFFGANSGTTAANPLNSEVDIVGSDAKRGHDYSAENLTTEVSQGRDGTTTITVKMDEKPTFTTVNTTEINLGDTNITTNKDGDVYIDDSKVITGTEQLLHVQGDEGKAKQIDRTFDETLHVEGGATGTLTDGNIGVTSDGRDTLTVKLAQNIDLGKAGSVTMGGTTVNNNGLTITGGPSVTTTGIDVGGKQITNVEAGTADTDAVNVSQLKSGLEEIHFTVANGSTGTGTSSGSSSDVYSGDTVTFRAGDNMVLEQNGNTLTYSADLSSVIDPGKGGGFGLTPDDTSKKVEQELGKTIGVIGDTRYDISGNKLADGDGNIITSVSKDKAGNEAIKVELAKDITVNNITTNEIHLGDTHITTNKNGDVLIDDSKVITGTEQLLHVQGDEGKAKQIDRTFDETLHVEGGATGALTDGNIGVTSDGTDTLTVKLAQNIDLGTAGSVKMGNTTINNNGLTINNGPSITNTGINAGDKKITNVAAGEISATSTDAVNGSQLHDVIVNVDAGWTAKVNGRDVKNVNPDDNTLNFVAGDNVVLDGSNGEVKISADLSSVIDPGKGGGFGLTPDDTSKSVKQDLGKTIGVIGDTQYDVSGTKLADGNIITSVSKDKAGNEAIKVELAKDITVNNITTNEIHLGDTHITTNKNGDVLIDDSKVITGTEQLLHVQGDEGDAKPINRTYNETLHVEGGATGTLTDGNIGVTSDGTDTLTVKLAQNIDLGTNGSVKMGDTTVNNSGLTIENGPTVTTDKVDVAGNQINNLASGLTDGNGRPVELKDAVGTNAVNVDDLRASQSDLTAKGLNFTADNYVASHSETKTNVPLGETLAVKGDANIITEVDTTKADQTVTITLNKNLTGIDGIGLNGVDGKDGEPGITTIKVEKGQPGVDGKDGITRIVYTDPDGDKQEVATLNDGLKFRGDDGVMATRKLNKVLDFEGGADKDSLTEGNIGVNYDKATAKMKVQLSKDIDLTEDGSVNIGDTLLNNDGLTINNGPTVTKDKVDVAGNQINNLASGLTDADGNPVDLKDATGDTLTNAVNVGDLKDAITGSEEKGLNFAANSNYNNEPVHKDLGETLTIKGSGTKANTEYTSKNIKTRTDAEGNVIVMMDKNLTNLESIGLNGKDGKDGTTTITVEEGQPGVDGKDGITRIVYTDPDGDKQEVATLNDGLKFRGDDGVMATRKLNKVLDFEGGADKETLTEGNIGVNYDMATAKMKVQLSKDIDLTEDGSVTMGDTVLNNGGLTIENGPVVTTDKVDVAGNQITSLASGLTDEYGRPTDVLDEAVGTNAVNVDDLRNSLNNATDELTAKGLNFTADNYMETHSETKTNVPLGETLAVKGDGNIITEVDTTKADQTVTITLNKNLTGIDGIGLNGVDGKDGEPGITTIKVEKGQPGVDGKDGITRIVYTDPDGDKQEVATLNDGLKFRGDDGVMATRKLNKVLDFEGGADKDSLTEGNIGVNYDKATAKMKVQLSKDIDLTEDGSVNIGDTLLNNDGLTINNGPTVTKDKVDVAGNQINNLASGLTDADGNPAALDDAVGTNAVNVDDLRNSLSDSEKDLINKGFGLRDDEGNRIQQKLGYTLGIIGDSVYTTTTTTVHGESTTTTEVEPGNILTRVAKDKDGKSAIQVYLNKDLKGFDSIGMNGVNGKDGEPGTTTIKVEKGQPGVDGKDGITRIVYTDPDGEKQEVATLNDGMKYGGDFGNVAAVKLNNQVNVVGNAENEKDLTDKNIGVVASQDGDNAKLIVKLNKDINLTDKGSVTIGDTLLNNDGLAITGGPTVTKEKVDVAGNQITSVGSGLKGADGNPVDLKDATGDMLNNAVNVGDLQKAAGDITSAGLDFVGDDGTVVHRDLGTTLGIKGEVEDVSTLTTGNIGVVGDAETGTMTVKLNQDLKDMNSATFTQKDEDGNPTGGTTVINGDGVTITGPAGEEGEPGKTVSLTGDGLDNGGNKIVNVAAGEAETDAVNVSQLKEVEQLASEHTTMTVNGGDYESGSQEGDLVLVESKNATGGIHYDVSLSDIIEIGGPGKDGADGKDGHIGVNGKDGKSGVAIDGKDGISVRGADGKDGVTIYAKDGEDGTEGHIGLNGKDGASADITVVKGDPGVNGKDGETMDRIQYEDGEGNPHQVATLDDGTKYKGDSGDQLAVPLNKVVNVKGGATGELTDGNIGVVGSAKDNTLNIKLAKDIKGLDSLEVKKINATTVNADEFHAGDVSVTKEGIDAGSKKIVNVAPGEVSATSRDAVNGSQLYQAQKQIYNNIENLDDRVKKVGAGAAALAGLHPLDFDPDAKWDVTAGYGHYRGKNAAAVGAFYRPDENTMLSVASTVGNGDNMVSAGVTLKIDGKSRVNNSRTAMGKQIIEMRKELEDLRALIADQAAGRQLDLSKLQLFPDTPENHWAYDYVATLAGNGLLEGYPDGNFKGDRELTRYEVAAILYRAMTNGAQLTERALKEFAPELNRIRVDTISHHSDGTPSIQRVRVVKGRG